MQIEQIPAVADWLIHGGEFFAFMGVAWKAISVMNRYQSLMRDYPPHRHIADEIVYPKEYQPAKTEKLP